MPRTAAPLSLHLDLDDGPRGSLTALTAALVKAIGAGQLADGDLLPSSRVLAGALGVGRSRVIEAYQQLAAAGFVVTVPGSGTRVEQGAVAAARAGALSSPVSPVRLDAPTAQPSGRARFDLRSGYPDVSLISARDWNRAWRVAAREFLESAAGAGGPGRPGGTPADPVSALRADLADHLRVSRGLSVRPEEVILFSGVHAAIQVLTRVMAIPSRTLAFETPGYDKALRAFRQGGARVRPVPVDDEGLRADRLTRQDWGVYVTPAHQFPLGGRMPVSRRGELLDWAERAGALVFEDDYDGEYRYDVVPMPPLRAMAAGPRRVIYLGTASKILARELRLAWAVVPGAWHDRVSAEQARDGGTVSGLAAAALSELIRSRALLRHLAFSHRVYAARRQRFADACAAGLPQARIHGIQAGLHLVLTFGDDFDDRAAVAGLERAGLLCGALSHFAYDERWPATGLVCGYATLPETWAGAAVQVIRDVLA